MGRLGGQREAGVKRQQLAGQRRVADAAGRAMAFMLVAVAVGGIGAAADGPAGPALWDAAMW
jgi:hypothetical protein